MKIWNKYYECCCHGQMIMAHYDKEARELGQDLLNFTKPVRKVRAKSNSKISRNAAKKAARKKK